MDVGCMSQYVEILFLGKIEELEKRIVENLEFSCN